MADSTSLEFAANNHLCSRLWSLIIHPKQGKQLSIRLSASEKKLVASTADLCFYCIWLQAQIIAPLITTETGHYKDLWPQTQRPWKHIRDNIITFMQMEESKFNKWLCREKSPVNVKSLHTTHTQITFSSTCVHAIIGHLILDRCNL